jgi:hypothetical protein
MSFGEVDSHSTSQSVTFDIKIHYRIHDGPLLVSILNHMNQPIPHYLIILILSPSMSRSTKQPPNKIFRAHLISHIRATFPHNLIILNLIVLVIFVEYYKLRNLYVCRCVQSHVIPPS